jgi:hypothetical protein
MYEGVGSMFCGYNILNPLLVTIDSNMGECLTTLFYSEYPLLKCMGKDVRYLAAIF